MAYTLFTQSFGAANANALATITEVGTGAPATILASAGGGVVSTVGAARLDGSGDLNVYIDTARSWNVSVRRNELVTGEIGEGGGGGGGGGGAITIADGADATQGSVLDAAVVAGTTGSNSAKLRAISRDVASLLTDAQLRASPVPVTIGATLTPVSLLTNVNVTGPGNAAADGGWTPTFYATISGTGAVSAMVQIEVRNSTSGAWVSYGTLTLSGTTTAADAIAGLARYLEYRANCTAISAGAVLNVVMVSSAGAAGGGGDASAANQLAGNISLTNIDVKTPSLLGGRVPTDALGLVGVARQIIATNTNTNTTLTIGIRAVSIYCRGANARYVIGSSAQTASATASHWIADGERLDLDVPATANLAVIRDSAATVNATIELTELF